MARFGMPKIGKTMTAALVAGLADSAVSIAENMNPSIATQIGVPIPGTGGYLPNMDRFVVPATALALQYGGKAMKKGKISELGSGMMYYALPRLVSDIVTKLAGVATAGAGAGSVTRMAVANSPMVSYATRGYAIPPVGLSANHQVMRYQVVG